MGRDGNDKQLLTLKVANHASKQEIKNAVEKIFGVKVEHVRVANYLGKIKRTMRQREGGRRPSWKKAYVTLRSGEKTIVYEDAI